MPIAIGALSKAGARIESDLGLVNGAYPTTEATADNEEVKVKSYDLIPFDSENIDDAHQWDNDITIVGKGGIVSSDRIAKLPSGALSCIGMYDGLDALLACTLGGEKWNSPDFTIGIEKTGTDGAIDAAADSVTSASNTFTTADVGRFIRFNQAGASVSCEGYLRRVSALESSTTITVTPVLTGLASLTNCGFELANEFKHTFVPTNNLEDELWNAVFSDYPLVGKGTSSDKIFRRLTLCIAKAVSLWGYRSVMINTLKISGSSKSALKFEFGIIPFDRVTDSLTDTRQDGTTVAGWKTNLTWSASGLFTPAINERIMFSDLVFRLGDYSTSVPLSSSNNVGISDFEININNNLLADDQDSVSGVYRKQPVRNGTREVSGSFSLPRYTADTWISKHNADTLLMAHFNFTGSTISTVSRALQIWLPNLKITGHREQIAGAGIVREVFDFQCFTPAGQASGFPAYPITDPNPDIIIQTTNQNPFSVFRDQNEEY